MSVLLDYNLQAVKDTTNGVQLDNSLKKKTDVTTSTVIIIKARNIFLTLEASVVPFLVNHPILHPPWHHAATGLLCVTIDYLSFSFEFLSTCQAVF